MTKPLILALVGLLPFAVPAHASSFQIAPNTVNLSILTDGLNFTNPDVRGSAGYVYIPSGTLGLLSDFGSPGNPNTALLAANAGVTETVFVGFDLGNLAFNGLNIDVIGTGTAFSALTEPAIAALVGPNVYRFTFVSSAPFVQGFDILTYNLTDINPTGVPEPSTVAMLGLGSAARSPTEVGTNRLPTVGKDRLAARWGGPFAF